MERTRKVKSEFVKQSWNQVQNNINILRGVFGSHFIEVDNSKFLTAKEAQQKFTSIAKQHISKFIKAPIKNPVGKKWIEKQLILKKRK